MIVNSDAVGGSQAAKDIMPVDAAAISITSFPSSTVIVLILWGVKLFFKE